MAKSTNAMAPRQNVIPVCRSRSPRERRVDPHQEAQRGKDDQHDGKLTHRTLLLVGLETSGGV